MNEFYKISDEVKNKAIDLIDNYFHDDFKKKMNEDGTDDFMSYLEYNVKDLDKLNGYLNLLTSKHDKGIDAMIWNYYFFVDSIFLKSVIKDIALESIKQRKLCLDNSIDLNVSKPYKSKDILLKPMNNKDSKNLIKAYKSQHLINVVPSLQFDKSIEKYNKEDKCMFSIYDKENTLVGEIALETNLVFNDSLNYNIEYFISPKYRRLGYASKACKAIVKMAFTNKIIMLYSDELFYYKYNKKIVDIRLIYATPDINNIASNKILTKNSFSKDCLILNCNEKGQYKFSNRYTLLKDDYLKKGK